MTRASRLVAIGFSLIAASDCGAAESLGKTKRATVAIENVAVVDVVAGQLTMPQTVVISNGRIAAITNPSAATVPDDAVKVDGKGRYLMPGLVDMHVHLFNNATHRLANDWAFPLFVANGVTSVREMRSELADLETIKDWRAAVMAGDLIAPQVLAAGVAVRGDSPESARTAVREARTRGAGFIKIFSEVPESHWRAILDEAGVLRMPVSGHIPATVSALTAAKAGQRTNEHLTQLYEACSRKEKEFLAARRGLDGDQAVKVRDAQERQVLAGFDVKVCREIAADLATTGQAQVPTLVLSDAESRGNRKQFRENPRWPSLRPDEQTRWESILEHQTAHDTKLAARRWEVSREIVSTLHKAGVQVLAGTDAPMPLVYPGSSLHKELELLVESGLSSADALRAATIWPAEFLGLSESTGSVAVGKQADLVLLDDNPLQAISNTRHIRAVLLQGRLLDRSDLDGLIVSRPH